MTKMARNRASQAELQKRRLDIQKMILQGTPTITIVEEMAKQYKTSKRAIQEDMRLIAKEWQERADEETRVMKNRYLERLELLFHEAISKGQVKIALEVQKEIHKFTGHYNDKEETEVEMPKFINVAVRPSSLKIIGNDES